MKKQEVTYRAVSGYLMFMIFLIIILAAIFSFMNGITMAGNHP